MLTVYGILAESLCVCVSVVGGGGAGRGCPALQNTRSQFIMELRLQ